MLQIREQLCSVYMGEVTLFTNAGIETTAGKAETQTCLLLKGLNIN